jgi:ABC-type Fe3+ transport system substrate-binding protein
VARRAPENYAQLLDPIPHGVVFQGRPTQSTDMVHTFIDRKAALEKELATL